MPFYAQLGSVPGLPDRGRKGATSGGDAVGLPPQLCEASFIELEIPPRMNVPSVVVTVCGSLGNGGRGQSSHLNSHNAIRTPENQRGSKKRAPPHLSMGGHSDSVAIGRSYAAAAHFLFQDAGHDRIVRSELPLCVQKNSLLHLWNAFECER